MLQNLNAHNNPSLAWKEIKALKGKTISPAQCRDGRTIANELSNQYAAASLFVSLPPDIQIELRKTSFDRQITTEIACAKKNEFDDAMITFCEFDITHCKSNALSKDGITLNRQTENGNEPAD